MEPEADVEVSLEQDWETEPIVGTVYFKMFEFKILRCPRVKPHDWTQCPFAHPTEKAKRRRPCRYKYNGIACADFRKSGTCRRGDACPFAHGVFEAWLHPVRYRTKNCNDTGKCRRHVCFFAHDAQELRDGTDDSLTVINVVKESMLQEILQDPILSASLKKVQDSVKEGSMRSQLAYAQEQELLSHQMQQLRLQQGFPTQPLAFRQHLDTSDELFRELSILGHPKVVDPADMFNSMLSPAEATSELCYRLQQQEQEAWLQMQSLQTSPLSGEIATESPMSGVEAALMCSRINSLESSASAPSPAAISPMWSSFNRVLIPDGVTGRRGEEWLASSSHPSNHSSRDNLQHVQLQGWPSQEYFQDVNSLQQSQMPAMEGAAVARMLASQPESANGHAYGARAYSGGAAGEHGLHPPNFMHATAAFGEGSAGQYGSQASPVDPGMALPAGNAPAVALPRTVSADMILGALPRSLADLQ